MTKKWNDPEAVIESQRYDNPIPSRTFISSQVEQSAQGLSYDQLANIFDLKDEDSLEALRRRLNAMVRDGQLLRIGQVYQLCNDDQEFDATVQINGRGQGFAVIAERDDLLLSERELRMVFEGDRIRVRPASVDKRGRAQGFITEVIKHQVQQLIGTLNVYDGEYFVQAAAPNNHQPITLESELVEHAQLKVGDSVRVAIDQYPTRDEFAAGHIVKSMADMADSEIIIPATILEYGLPYEFPADVIAEAEKFKAPSAAERKHRIDLRELPLVTIDGEDARDFDDAVYAEKRAGGGYRVVVAIADVSHYVKIGQPLDDEAQLRGTSVYFPNFVLPMLPEALSNGLCSLNPHVDRLCMVCDLVLTRTGKVSSYAFYPAVMHSKARLTYTQVADYLAGQTDAIAADTAVQKSINTLYQLYQVLLKLRQKRHAMEFETIETYMTFDDKGAIKQILPRSRNDAHRLIEECMLLANVAAADFASKHEIPVLYRVHEPPELSRIQKVRDYVKLLGLTFPERPTQADYQRVIDATKDRIDAASIHAVLLRSMMQAYYSPKNAGHYGLAYEAYTHFTSPIRRYPDLLLHRAIKAKLANKPYPLQGATLDAAGQHYSQTERRADEASRSVTSWLKCHYMQQHIGEQFSGVISAVTDFGLFVTLQDLYVDGMIHISQLGDDYFVHDVALQRLVGQHRGQIFALGDTVEIKVAAVNLEDRKIDFALVKLLSSSGRAARSRAPRSHAATTPTPLPSVQPQLDATPTRPKRSRRSTASVQTQTVPAPVAEKMLHTEIEQPDVHHQQVTVSDSALAPLVAYEASPQNMTQKVKKAKSPKPVEVEVDAAVDDVTADMMAGQKSKPKADKPKKAKAEKVKAEKVKTEKVKAEKVKTEKVKAKKVKVEKVKAEKVKTEKVKAEKNNKSKDKKASQDKQSQVSDTRASDIDSDAGNVLTVPAETSDKKSKKAKKSNAKKRADLE